MKKSELKQLIKEQILAEYEYTSGRSLIYGETIDGKRIEFKLDKDGYLDCNKKDLKILTVNDPKVKIIYCDNNQLTILKLGRLPNLEILDCSENNLASLDVSKCSNLEKLYCYTNQLKSLNLSGCPNLKILYCNRNQLTNLDISKYPNLERLWCKENKLTTLDISNCPNLERLLCDDEVKVIKNTLTETHNKTFTDDEMLKSVKNYHNMKYLSRHNVNLYKAVKEKEKTDPEFFKKLKSHMVSKTNYPPQEHNIAELVSVATMRIPNNFVLAKLIEKNPKIKQDLINLSLQAMGPHTNNPDWDHVRKGWIKSELKVGTDYNINDEIMLDDGSDDRLFLSVNPINGRGFIIHELNYGGQTIYQTYY
jgi:hypothetical protein